MAATRHVTAFVETEAGGPTQRYQFARCTVNTLSGQRYTISPGVHFVAVGDAVSIGNRGFHECRISSAQFKLLRAEGRAVPLD